MLLLLGWRLWRCYCARRASVAAAVPAPLRAALLRSPSVQDQRSCAVLLLMPRRFETRLLVALALVLVRSGGCCSRTFHAALLVRAARSSCSCAY